MAEVFLSKMFLFSLKCCCVALSSVAMGKLKTHNKQTQDNMERIRDMIY